jgi:hypothetical protein
MGVFATRSPFRPNSIGLSCACACSVCGATRSSAPVLDVGGADLMDGTPIYDITPYAPYADAHPEALAGFASARPDVIPVTIPGGTRGADPCEKRAALRGVLAHDPRPRYQRDEARVYADMDFAASPLCAFPRRGGHGHGHGRWPQRELTLAILPTVGLQ